MKDKAFKKKMITSLASSIALVAVCAASNISSKASYVSNNSLSLPSTTTNPKVAFITLNDKNANFGLRAYPKVSTESNVVAKLKSGTKVTAYSESVVNEKITWVKVKSGGKIGWVNERCLTEIYIDERENYWRYSSEESAVIIKKTRRFDSDVYTAKIKINDPLQFKHVYAAGQTWDRTLKTVPEMTKRYKPIIAINATACDVKNNNEPRGTIGSLRKIDYFVKYDTTKKETCRPSLVYGMDGKLNIGYAKEETSFDKYNPFWITSFGPALIKDGTTIQTPENNAKTVRHPRMAIGQGENPNEFVIIVVDGRSSVSKGVNYYELATLFEEQGARVAYNLDGGGSATLVFNGKILNDPRDTDGTQKVRAVTDSIFIRDIIKK